MIFMICSTVAPGFGVRIVSTPVILGCGGVDWPCARGARTIANAGSRKDIAMFIVFSSFDSGWNLDPVLVPLGTTLWFRRSREEKVTPGNKDSGTIRYHSQQERVHG